MTDSEWFLKEGEKDVMAMDLMIEALFKSTISSYEELAKHSGKLEALAAVKPYRKWGAHLYVDDLRKRGVIQGDGPDAMLFAQAFGAYSIGVPPDKIVAEIKEKGTVCTVQDCPFAGVGSLDLCISISHVTSEEAANYINPEYECVWINHESSGDPYCRFVFKKKSEPVSVVDDMGKTLVTLPRFELPPEQLQGNMLYVLNAQSYHNIGAFHDLHGDEKTREVIGGMEQRIGQELGARLANENPELRESVESVGKLVRAMQNAMGQRDAFSVVSPDEVSDEITNCSQTSGAYAPCDIRVESLFKGMVSAINPDFEFAYDRMMSKGDATCHWTVRKKGEESSKPSEAPEVFAEDEALKTLRLRYAKGEISKEEYREMKKELEG